MPVNLGYPFATLTVNPDKSVTRTQVTNDTGAALQWVVLYNGRVVLQRNARNETTYKYFRSDPGVYTLWQCVRKTATDQRVFGLSTSPCWKSRG